MRKNGTVQELQKQVALLQAAYAEALRMGRNLSDSLPETVCPSCLLVQMCCVLTPHSVLIGTTLDVLQVCLHCKSSHPPNPHVGPHTPFECLIITP